MRKKCHPTRSTFFTQAHYASCTEAIIHLRSFNFSVIVLSDPTPKQSALTHFYEFNFCERLLQLRKSEAEINAEIPAEERWKPNFCEDYDLGRSHAKIALGPC